MSMRGINQVILIGYVGHEPERRYTPDGHAVTRLSIATHTVGKNAKQQPHGHTEWHRVILLGRFAELAGDYLHAGNKVYVQGELRTRKWQDKQGADRFVTEIIASDIVFLDNPGIVERLMASHEMLTVPMQDEDTPQFLEIQENTRV